MSFPWFEGLYHYFCQTFLVNTCLTSLTSANHSIVRSCLELLSQLPEEEEASLLNALQQLKQEEESLIQELESIEVQREAVAKELADGRNHSQLMDTEEIQYV